MGRMEHGNETREAWYFVLDPKERKRIQDRLAQRARRRRIAEASHNSEGAIILHSARDRVGAVEHEASSRCGNRSIVPGSMAVASANLTLSSDSASRSLNMRDNSNSTTIRPHIPCPGDPRFLIDPNKAAWVAFDENGRRMGINSLCVGLVCSWRQPSDVPETLQPTPLQLTTPHPIWLDRLPFPRFRDNMILLIQMINLEEFYVDLFLRDSFHVDKAKASYDPAAYRIDSAFRAKWGYLFH